MARLAPDKIYTLFESFVNDFIINKKFCLLAESDEYTEDKVEESLKGVIKCFVQNPIDSNSNSEDEEANELKFKQKLEQQFENEELAKLCFSHINWLWAFAASDMKGSTKNKYPFDSLNEKYHKISQDYVLDDNMGIGSASPRQQKYYELVFIIKAIEELWNSNKQLDEVKKSLEEFCNKNHNDEILKKNLSIKNAIMHLCNPDYYEPMFSHSQKKSIVQAFSWLIPEKKNEKNNDIKLKHMNDIKLKSIRDILNSSYNFPKDFSFYDDGIRELWQIDDKKVDNLDEVQLLEYKQAMILYGPPGTSKTYSAINLAKLLVARGMIKVIINESDENNDVKKKLGQLLSKDKDEVKNVLSQYVDRLQMHINYNYEDFVVGQVIEANNIVAKKGYIFDAIKKAQASKSIPYVVILDEINRTDISRVFGEVFSAMEYRGDEIKLPLKDTDGEPMSLCIPENLYFIGTMNEIDFSLERIDFALRRRFVWILKTFESSRLKAILMEMPDSQMEEKEIDMYCKQCEALNDIISNSELGDNYVIGHAFFADIQKIIGQFQGSKKWEKSKQVLWQISIGPIIEAYCGSMEKSNKIQLLKQCAAKLGLSLDDKGKVSISNGKSEKK